MSVTLPKVATGPAIKQRNALFIIEVGIKIRFLHGPQNAKPLFARDRRRDTPQGGNQPRDGYRLPATHGHDAPRAIEATRHHLAVAKTGKTRDRGISSPPEQFR